MFILFKNICGVECCLFAFVCSAHWVRPVSISRISESIFVSLELTIATSTTSMASLVVFVPARFCLLPVAQHVSRLPFSAFHWSQCVSRLFAVHIVELAAFCIQYSVYFPERIVLIHNILRMVNCAMYTCEQRYPSFSAMETVIILFLWLLYSFLPLLFYIRCLCFHLCTSCLSFIFSLLVHVCVCVHHRSCMDLLYLNVCKSHLFWWPF